jgi:hypothetical protein
MDENNSRLILESPQHIGTVLSQPLVNDVFHSVLDAHGGGSYLAKQSDYLDSVEHKDINGTHFLFKINLRRLDGTDNSLTGDTVLKIKIPWHNKEGGYRTRAFFFSTLPSSSLADTLSIDYYEYRGKEMDTLPLKDSIFAITKSMLPVFDGINDPDITLAGLFRTTDFENRYFKGNTLNLPIDPDRKIDSIGIEVEYVGGLDIAIDWIKILTPAADMVYKGMIDDTLANVHQSIFDTVTTPRYTDKGIRFPRLQPVHEYGIQHWAMVRFG